jgi:hypothetical protein
MDFWEYYNYSSHLFALMDAFFAKHKLQSLLK